MQSEAISGARAVFVLGLQRSGTTWIANMLHGSGAVAAITAPEHRGVHESIFFSHFAEAFGPLTDTNGRAAFRTAFLASDYWLLSGLQDEDLDKALVAATDYADVFEAVMDEFADREDADMWLEKSPQHTLMAQELASRYPGARFICVTRASRTLIASRLSAYGRTPTTGVRRFTDILRGALANALYTRHLEAFVAKCPQAHLFCYDSLAADPAQGRAMLAGALDLTVDPEVLVSHFAPNTSHEIGGMTRKLSALDSAACAFGDMLGRALPLSALRRIELRRRMVRGLEWPDWVWQRTGYRP